METLSELLEIIELYKQRAKYFRKMTIIFISAALTLALIHELTRPLLGHGLSNFIGCIILILLVNSVLYFCSFLASILDLHEYRRTL